MKQILLICAAMMLLGCGKKAPEQEAEVPDANPPAKPKVELTEATLTPGMKAAKKAHEAGNYREAAQLYTVELAKAKEYWEKAYAICLKKLGPNHPDTKDTKTNLDELKE